MLKIKIMRYLKIVVILTLVSMFSAGILSLADLLSKEKILENQRKAVNQAIKRIIPQAERVKKEKGIYKIFNREGNLLGYVFLSEGQGYQGEIQIVCGTDSSFKELLGIEIIESKETPGLGAKINKDWFREQFKNLNIFPKIEWTKSKPKKDNQIEAITGATISSKSVVNIINKRIEELRKQFKL